MNTTITIIPTIQKKSHFDQRQLYALSQKIGRYIQQINQMLSLDLYTNNSHRFYGKCPVHGGDNNRALTIYANGIWKCRSHQCHETFTSSLVGFIRGILSHNEKQWVEPGDPIVSLFDTIEYLESIKISVNTNMSEEELNTYDTINAINSLCISKETSNELFSKPWVHKALNIPASHFIPKYHRDILIKYDVGLCVSQYARMSNRVVIPIYDENYKHGVACTGRTIFPQCDKCDKFHNVDLDCSTQKIHHAKWLSIGLENKRHLFNYWFAKPYIKTSRSVCIVESAGNVLKLVQNGIENVVGIFGTNMSQHQYNTVVQSGALYLNLLFDNDEGGQKGLSSIIRQFKNIININVVKLNKSYNDVSDTTDEYVVSDIKPQIKSYNI